jgi:hypothetical protein
MRKISLFGVCITNDNDPIPRGMDIDRIHKMQKGRK